jgi:hypothetical protein
MRMIIDLMKYSHAYRPSDILVRSVAAEDDVKSLLWLGRINFND